MVVPLYVMQETGGSSPRRGDFLRIIGKLRIAFGSLQKASENIVKHRNFYVVSVIWRQNTNEIAGCKPVKGGVPAISLVFCLHIAGIVLLTVQPQAPSPPLLPPVPPPLTHQPNAAYSGDSEAANFCIGLMRLYPYQV